mmetsp:Transcript_10881/g.16796  ORF Transcript_10881/g.16796 Transcript_10881/m.16796 type:complete len:173 (-) Transcript_10881:270-788(-)|eukprot:CAMPEP_0195287668 /NCGR_PEP_ID=MMETSP0707-20130614/4641_1 /TAXON_ID=33640 /ORGANISM="Asterionellopsis glacialis, Strain CCMP134" /LENGTH=172 /DNA_ID=CAMNT_0040347449 /DNA_START=136 /DNA_END=654 /DNA_ORIENTATION=+
MSDILDTMFLHMLNAALSNDSHCNNKNQAHDDDDQACSSNISSIWRDQERRNNDHQEDQEHHSSGSGAAELLCSSFSSRSLELNSSFSYDRMHEESLNNKKAWQATALPQLQSHIRHTFGNEAIDQLMNNASSPTSSPTSSPARRGRSGSHGATPPRSRGHHCGVYTVPPPV